jgi:hypothetical protein
MGSTVAVTGGTAGTTYRFSTGYIQEDGNIHNLDKPEPNRKKA